MCIQMCLWGKILKNISTYVNDKETRKFVFRYARIISEITFCLWNENLLLAEILILWVWSVKESWLNRSEVGWREIERENVKAKMGYKPMFIHSECWDLKKMGENPWKNFLYKFGHNRNLCRLKEICIHFQ